MFAILTLASLLPLLALAAPDEASGVVTNIIDGDTFDIWIEKTDSRIIYEVERVRLADVYAPDISKSEGPQAAIFATEALLGKRVWLDIDDLSGDGRDSDERIIAVVYLEDLSGGINATPFNRLLVDAGFAVVEDDANNEFDPDKWWTRGIGEPEPSSTTDLTDKPITQLSGSDFSDWLPTDWLQTKLQLTEELDGLEYWGGYPLGMSRYPDWYVGPVYSDKYRYPDYEWAQRTSPEHGTWFS